MKFKWFKFSDDQMNKMLEGSHIYYVVKNDYNKKWYLVKGSKL